MTKEPSGILSPAASRLKNCAGWMLGFHRTLVFQGIALALCLLSYRTGSFAQAPKPAGSSSASPAAGEASAALNDLYRKSIEHFAKGSYEECIAGLKEMLSQGAEGPGIEALYFTIAAAHFNLKQHKNALDGFREYLAKFPKGDRWTEAMMGVGQSQMALGEKEAALTTFEEVAAKSPTAKDKASLLRAALLKETGKVKEAMEMLRPAVTGNLNTEDAVQQACLLAAMEAASGEAETAIKILSYLQQRMYAVENPLQINALAFEVGDALLGRRSTREALRAYALVRPKAEVIGLQRAKLEAMIRRRAGNVEAAKLNPSKAAEFHQANATLMSAFEEGKKILEQVDQVDDFMIPLRMRQARAYQEMARHWESVLLLESVLSGSLSAEIREEVLFALSVSHSELGNSVDLDAVIARYQKEFPKGKNAEAVDFMVGLLLLQKDDFAKAETVFSRMVKLYPAGEKAPTALFLLANTRFAAARYGDALGNYADYLKKYPKESFAEEARYRTALCHFFLGDYAMAHPVLESYVKDSPEGAFAADAHYRIAVCYQAAGKFAEVVKRCHQWEKDFVGHSLQPEVSVLQGDALAAQDKREEAAASYEKALQVNPSDQVLGYALLEANKLYQKQGRWDLSTRLFQDFLEKHPGHPAEVTAVYWLSKSMARDGKLEEARKMLAHKVADTIADRSRDAVEQVITQLVQLCAKKPAQTSPPLAGAAGESVPLPYDPAAELHRFLALVKSADPLTKARLYFAEAELARLTRKPNEAAQWMDKIADEIEPKALGAALLAQMGDRLLSRKENVKARMIFEELMKSFPQSELLDFAYHGMGQMELSKGNFKEALRWFVDAMEKVGAASKLKEVTLGKAKALVGLGNLEEAKPIFEQVAATREWRGEVTAEAVLFLGEIAFQKKEYAAAVQFFQRVFVAYQRYPGVVARAYLRAADCFEQLGETDKAAAHLREMVSREKLAGMVELEQGRKRLEAMTRK